MDLKEINILIDRISYLKEGETIDSFGGSVQNKSSWSTTFYRTLYGDSRIRVCQYIEGIVNQLIAIIISDKTLREDYIEKITPLQSGLRVLIRTYSDDLVSDLITPLIAELDIIYSKYKISTKSQDNKQDRIGKKSESKEILFSDTRKSSDNLLPKINEQNLSSQDDIISQNQSLQNRMITCELDDILNRRRKKS